MTIGGDTAVRLTKATKDSRAMSTCASFTCTHARPASGLLFRNNKQWIGVFPFSIAAKTHLRYRRTNVNKGHRYTNSSSLIALFIIIIIIVIIIVIAEMHRRGNSPFASVWGAYMQCIKLLNAEQFCHASEIEFRLSNGSFVYKYNLYTF